MENPLRVSHASLEPFRNLSQIQTSRWSLQSS
jgi:hypothetical protein